MKPSTKLTTILILLQTFTTTILCKDEKVRDGEDLDVSPMPILAGYFPDYRAYIDIGTSTPHMTDLILFSIQPNLDGSVDGSKVCCLSGEHYETSRMAKKRPRANRRSMNVLVSVGGAGRSDAFASISSNEGRRGTFIRNLKALW